MLCVSSMETFVFIGIYMFASGWFRSRLDAKDLSFKERLPKGLAFGFISGAIFLVFAIQYRSAKNIPEMGFTELGLYFCLFFFLGVFSSLRRSDDDGEDLRKLLDDPKNITPKQRMRAIREKNETANKTHNKSN